MSTQWQESQATIDTKLNHLQAELDEDVARMQAECDWHKIHLRHQRNNLALVNRLPREVLSAIFLMSLVTSQASFCSVPSALNPYARIYRRPGHWPQGSHFFDPAQKGVKPDYFQLCHVCRYWRGIALGSPELWVHIEVTTTMKPELLDFIQRQTKGLLLDLDVHYARDMSARQSVLLMLHAGTGRLRSLAFHSSYLDLDLQPDLFERATTLAPHLQSLQLVVEGSPAQKERNPFSSGTPNLRCFESKGTIIPWSATVFTSPRLTRLILHHTPQFTTSTLIEFVSFLRQVPQLKTLHIGHHWVCPPGSVEGQVVQPVRLPDVNRLHIISNFAAPLLLFMAIIDLPDDSVESIKVICRKEPEISLPAVCDFTGVNVAPEQVDITWGVYGDLALGYTVTYDAEIVHFDEDTGAIQLSFHDLPGIALNTGTKFPFPSDPSCFRVPWSFERLRHLAIGGALEVSIPREFWKELGSLQTLEVVQFKYAKMNVVQPFLATMAGNHGNSMFELVSIGQLEVPGQLGDSEAPTQPYSALRVILFESMDKTIHICSNNLRDLGCDPPRSWDDMGEAEVFVRFAARQLARWRNRGQRYLDYLFFHGQAVSRHQSGMSSRRCRLLEDMDDEIVKELGQCASNIMLGERLHTIR